MTILQIVPASIGAIIVASIALFLCFFQAVVFFRLKNQTGNKWGSAASFIVFIHSTSVFFQYNLGEGPFNLLCEHIQMSGFLLVVYVCYRFTLDYFGMVPSARQKSITILTFGLQALIWWPGFAIGQTFIHRKFLWLTRPYIEPSLTPVGGAVWIIIGLFGLYILKLWYDQKERAGREGRFFMTGFGICYLLCIHDLFCAFGYVSVQYLNIYGFMWFLMAFFGITIDRHLDLYREIRSSARALETAKNQLEQKVEERTRDLTQGNIALESAVKRLRESENRISILSDQTEQFSMAAASMLLIKNEQEFFDTVSEAIVTYSDYERVLISLFKDTHPFRDIIGFGGVEPEVVERLKKVEMPAGQYDHVFETGVKVGHQSYYIPHTMKEILRQEATVYGTGEVSDQPDAWHPEDNLFVKMMNEKNEFIGVISVDSPRSGQKPTDETVRPLEIFSSLISQILALKREQEKSRILEEQLMTARRMESIGRLTGGIAHDFNNILGVIIGNTELVLGKLKKTDEIYADLESIRYAGDKAADIVNRLLSFGKNAKVDLKPVCVDGIFKDLTRLVQSTVPSTIEVSTDFKDRQKVILADQVQVNQVFFNLCLNAAQSMEDRGGTIRIASEAVTLSSGEAAVIPELSPGEYIRISVADNGPGIDPEIQDRIFDPYFTTKDFGKGSGIGLAVVQGIVRSHHGHVSVKSRSGQGTRFDLLFPVTDKAPVEPPDLSPVIETGEKEHILLVDDDLMILNMMDKILAQLQYRVTAFSDPEKALAHLSETPETVDMVITDMTMPQMSGLSLAQKISRINPELPLIICTGYSDSLNGKSASDLGVSALLMKPVRVNILAAEIKKIFRKKGSQ